MDKCSFDLKSPSDKSRRVFFGSDDDDRMYPTTMDHFRAQRTASGEEGGELGMESSKDNSSQVRPEVGGFKKKTNFLRKTSGLGGSFMANSTAPPLQNPVNTGILFKHMQSWLKPLEAEIKGYMKFRLQMDDAFENVKEDEYDALILWTKAQVVDRGYNLRGVSSSTWPLLRTALAECVGLRETQASAFDELYKMEREHGEDLFAFYNRLILMMQFYIVLVKQEARSQVEVDIKQKQAEKHICEVFIWATDDQYSLAIFNQKPKDIRQAYMLYREMDVASKKKKPSKDGKLDEVLNLVKEMSFKKVEAQNGRFVNPEIRWNEIESSDLISVICQLCGRANHSAPDCYSLIGVPGKSKQLNNQQVVRSGDKFNRSQNSSSGRFNRKWSGNGNGFSINRNGNQNNRFSNDTCGDHGNNYSNNNSNGNNRYQGYSKGVGFNNNNNNGYNNDSGNFGYFDGNSG